MKETEARVNEVKASILEQNKGKDLIKSRILEQCWNNMEVKPKCVVALKADIRVDTFVTRTRSPEETALTNKVLFLRKMQMMENQWMNPSPGKAEGDDGMLIFCIWVGARGMCTCSNKVEWCLL